MTGGEVRGDGRQFLGMASRKGECVAGSLGLDYALVVGGVHIDVADDKRGGAADRQYGGIVLAALCNDPFRVTAALVSTPANEPSDGVNFALPVRAVPILAVLIVILVRV